MNDKALAIVNDDDAKLVPIFGASPQQMVAVAAQMATTLADVIKRQNLAIRIGPQYYVKVDGWAVLCSMMGLQPTEKSVVETTPGVWEAIVELINIKSGNIVARGSAICSCKERRWSTADDYARRSMAITRATGKACRLGLGWIMHMAGYESTPAEEVEGLELETKQSNGNGNITAASRQRPPHPINEQAHNKDIEKKSNIKQVSSDDLVAIFREINVGPEDLEHYLDKTLDGATPEDLCKLRYAYNRIRKGERPFDVLQREKQLATAN